MILIRGIDIASAVHLFDEALVVLIALGSFHHLRFLIGATAPAHARGNLLGRGALDGAVVGGAAGAGVAVIRLGAGAARDSGAEAVTVAAGGGLWRSLSHAMARLKVAPNAWRDSASTKPSTKPISSSGSAKNCVHVQHT